MPTAGLSSRSANVPVSSEAAGGRTTAQMMQSRRRVLSLLVVSTFESLRGLEQPTVAVRAPRLAAEVSGRELVWRISPYER